MSPAPTLPNSLSRGIALGFILIVAIIVGITGGILTWIGGTQVAMSIVAGAGAFVTATLLGIAIAAFVWQ
jgi:hypothetical protein